MRLRYFGMPNARLRLTPLRRRPRSMAILACASLALTFTSCGSAAAGKPALSAATLSAGAPLRTAAAADALAAATFVGTYAATFDPPGGAIDASVVVYKKGDRSRIDVRLAGSTAVAFSAYRAPEGDALCAAGSAAVAAIVAQAMVGSATAAAGRGPRCIRRSGGTATAFLDFSTIGRELRDGTLVATATRRIAGIDSDCFAGSAVDASTTEVCVSRDGALLYLGASGDRPAELRATSVSAHVDSAAFALPYPLDPSP